MESWHSYFSSLGPADDDKSFSELPVLQLLPDKLWPLHELCIGEVICSLLEFIGGSRFNFRKCVFLIYFIIWKGARYVLSAFENPIQMISCLGSPKSSACTNTDSELLRGWKLLPCSVNPLIAEHRTSEHYFPTTDLNYRAKPLDPSPWDLYPWNWNHPGANIFWIISFTSFSTWPEKCYSSTSSLNIFKMFPVSQH